MYLENNVKYIFTSEPKNSKTIMALLNFLMQHRFRLVLHFGKLQLEPNMFLVEGLYSKSTYANIPTENLLAGLVMKLCCYDFLTSHQRQSTKDEIEPVDWIINF